MSDDVVRPIRPGMQIPEPLPDDEGGPVSAWQAAMADCLSDGGLAGGLMIWRDNEGRVAYSAVAWDALQVVGALSVAKSEAESEAGARARVADTDDD